jgi:hypothetical protein
VKAKPAFAVGGIFSAIASVLIAGSPARAAGESVSDATFTALVCASGYHLGPHGNCQPKYHPGRRCQHGYTSEPFPNGNGYRCVPKGY